MRDPKRYCTPFAQSVHLNVRNNILQRIGVDTRSTAVRTVADFVKQVFNLALCSPNHLYFILDLIDSQIDPTFYHQHSLISLFLRKIVIAFHSLNFESVSKVFNRLQTVFSDLVNPPTTNDHADAHSSQLNKDNDGFLHDDHQSPYKLVNSIRSVIMYNHLHQRSDSLLSPQHFIDVSSGADGEGGGSGNITSILKHYYTHFYSMLMFKEMSVSFDYLHKYFDQIQYHQLHDNVNTMKEKEDKKHEYTILGLSMNYIQLNNITNAFCSLKDCLRYSNLLNDQSIRKKTLKWLSYIECRNISKKHLLYMHANDLLSLKFHLFHTVFTPISIHFDYSIMNSSGAGGNPNNTGNSATSNSSSSSNSYLYNRMKTLLPVNLPGSSAEDGSAIGNVGKEEQIKKLILSTYIKMELGDLLNARTNIEIAIELCEMHNLNYLYIQSKVLSALIQFELGHVSLAISMLSNHLKAQRSDQHNERNLLPIHYESIQYTLVYLQFIRALRRGNLRLCERYKKVLKSYASVYEKQSQQQLNYKQVVLNYMECEMEYSTRNSSFASKCPGPKSVYSTSEFNQNRLEAVKL